MAELWRGLRVCSIFAVLVGVSPAISCSQTRINPSLPSAPLPHSDSFTLFPGYQAAENSSLPVPPLTARQKFALAYSKIFSPALPIDALTVSAFDQATNLGPAYGQEWGAFGKRVAYNGANYVTKSLFANAIVPAAFHQDPRYFRLGEGPVGKRIGWVLFSQIAAYSDRGTLMPNYGKLFGYAASTALSNVYMPRQSISFVNDVKGDGIKFGVSIGVDLVHEFKLARFVQVPGSHHGP